MATSSTSAITITGPLRIGSGGDGVRTVQSILNKSTTPSPGLAKDGRFGLKTDVAVRAFQKRNGLTADAMGLKFVHRAQPAIKPDAPGTPQPAATVAPQAYLLHVTVQDIKHLVQKIYGRDYQASA